MRTKKLKLNLTEKKNDNKRPIHLCHIVSVKLIAYSSQSKCGWRFVRGVVPDKTNPVEQPLTMKNERRMLTQSESFCLSGEQFLPPPTQFSCTSSSH